MTFLYQMNQFLWGGPILVLLLGIHIYHTLCLHGIQRKVGLGIRLSLGSSADESTSSRHGFGRFGSLATTLAATLGTGNIIGMSTAVYLGGPGAVFWCWLTGALGMATTYAETFLCSRFRFEENGKLHGGPMYILKHLLKRPKTAMIYSFFLCLSAFCIGCTTQSNAITDTCHNVFDCSPSIPAILTAFLVGLVLMQGSRWIERFSMIIVPAMGLIFLGICLLYLVLHGDYIFPALREILRSAFGNSSTGISSAGAGVLGFFMNKAVRFGIARGLFTNEAGLGTAGLIAGHGSETSPEKQALISMSATFWDTVVLCALTGVVLVSYQLEFPTEWLTLSPGSLVTAAAEKLPFFGSELLAITVICFALATLVGWSYIGRQGFTYLFRNRFSTLYYTIYVCMIFIGGVMPLTLVWELTDMINLFLLIPSVMMLILCRKRLND